MPNWCINYVTLTAPSKDEADRFEAYLTQTNGEDLCNYFRPFPEDKEDDERYVWCIENWGAAYLDRVDLTRRTGNAFEIEFGSAWAPPIALYDYLSQNNWVIDAMYFEPGD